MTLKDGRLDLARGDVHGPLTYWNASNFRWLLPITAPPYPQFIKFEITADNTVTGLYFGLAGDVTLVAKKAGERGSGRNR